MRRRVVALSGGIGGAKLALGLSRILDPGDLVVIANTGDDFVHLGFPISPDIDTLVYTLSDLADPERGWGRRDETWTFMKALATLGGETWFQLGDGDLALHAERMRRRAAGESLTAITDAIRRQLGVTTSILPMCDEPVGTELLTADGWLAFQDYFVRRRCEPVVSAIRFRGAEAATLSEPILECLRDPNLRAIIICPSNPFISVDPILAVPGMRAALRASGAPIVAVTPIIGGSAVKGPTAKMMRELGLRVSADGVARHYDGLIDGFVADDVDRAAPFPEGITIAATRTLMTSLDDREALARRSLDVADRLAGIRSMPAEEAVRGDTAGGG